MPTVDTRPRGRRAQHLIWAINVALAAAAVALFAGPAAGEHPIAHPHIPWWALAPAFALAERCVIHMLLRRSAHSFSLTDVPLAVALVFCSPRGAMLALAAGSLVAFALRRQRAVKLVFNVAQFAFVTGVAALVLHAIVRPGERFGPRAWGATFAATELSGLITVGLL